MAKLFIGEQEAKWFDVDREPFNGDVRLKIRGATQVVLDRVGQRAKANRKYRAHHEDVGGKRTLRPANQAEAWSEEFLIEVIEDWEGVEGDDGQPLECTDATKPLLMRSSVAVNFITEKAALLAQVRVEEESKN